MSTRPRNLRMLRIDDQLRFPKRLAEDATVPLGYRDELPPEHIEHVEFGQIIGIRSWDTAISFWSEFDPKMRVDLVVADVRFEDYTSPLSYFGGPNVLPTGISHFKPFAAIARALGAPIGMAVHTMDAETWKNKLQLQNDPVQRTMGRFAAHEIGELAAILQQIPENFASLDQDARLAFCWEWLSNNRASDFDEAFPKALSDFRKRLAAVVVPPEDWTKLANWCVRMSTDPAPFGSDHADFQSEQANDDPGFSFILADGTPQCISLRSLFADVLKVREGFKFETDPLPSHCFKLRQDKEFFKLDDDGYPRIGALVQECSHLHDVYERALRVLEHFSQDSTHNLTTVENGAFTAEDIAFAILFKYVEQQCFMHRAWMHAFEHYSWDQSHDRFIDTPGNSKTLRTLVGDVANVFSSRANRAQTFFAADLKEALPDIELKTITRCLDILLSLGHVKRLHESEYGFKTEFKSAAISLPTDFAGELSTSAGLSEPLTLPPRQYLAVAFGYDRKNYNSVQGRLSKAFGPPGRNAGREFFERFLDGEAPPYVKILCRQYARAIGWASQSVWPRALQQNEID